MPSAHYTQKLHEQKKNREWYSFFMALINNKKATFDYDILDSFEAGMVLHGFEVKSLRASRGSLVGARVIIRGGEAFLVGASIPPYQPGNTPDSYDPERARKLLLSQAEIRQLAHAEEQKGLTIVPILVYNKGRNLKIEIAIARGKKKHDKRQALKERDEKRQVQRTLKKQF